MTPKAVVDERVELLSIVFRLAEAEEYVNNEMKEYAADIDSYFEPYKNHDLIKFISEIRNEYGIAYDAVASFAVHIQIQKGKISFIENVDERSLDSRWTAEVASAFCERLSDFYAKSKFHTFFKKHKSLYKKAEERFAENIASIDFDWFKSFYGVENRDQFNLIISLTNGPGNYGPKVSFQNGEEHLYAIIGSSQIDNKGYPTYSTYIQSIILHEFSHSFCNEIGNEIYLKVKDQVDQLYAIFAMKFAMQAYGQPQTILNEILVRASVIQYYKNHQADPNRILQSIVSEKSSGFIWIEKLCDLLTLYEQDRQKYPSLHSFIPEIIKLIEGIQVDELIADYEQYTVKIISSSIQNGDTAVDPSLQTLSVFFDKLMNIGANGCSDGLRGAVFFPKIIGAEWNTETQKEWILQISLKPDTEYSISFPDQFFIGANNETVYETYFLDFKTRKE